MTSSVGPVVGKVNGQGCHKPGNQRVPGQGCQPIVLIYITVHGKSDPFVDKAANQKETNQNMNV